MSQQTKAFYCVEYHDPVRDTWVKWMQAEDPATGKAQLEIAAGEFLTETSIRLVRYQGEVMEETPGRVQDPHKETV
jgi:hypothetical protein